MALIPKNDVTQIFAIQAPAIDLPPTFANYPRGWDTARTNNGKPTIKQFNYIQQRTDQNVLWIHQNGAALPYDAAMEYAENAHVVKDGELQKKQGASWVSATNKGYNLDYFVSGKSYPLHAEIMLANGDIVKSTVPNNITNPNIDMTGWIKTNDASFVVDGDKNQHQINQEQLAFNASIGKVVNSIESLRGVDKAQYSRAFVTGYYNSNDDGGGQYYLDTTDTVSTDNGGTIIVAVDGGRWKLLLNDHIDIRCFGAKGDGVTVNSAATIQKAIDVARELKLKVYVPIGTFMVDRRLLIGSDTYIFGDGDKSVIKAVANFPNSVSPWVTYHLLFNDGTSRATPDSNITLRNFCVDGNRDGQPLDMPNTAPLVYLVTQDGSNPMQNIVIDGLFINTTWQGTTNGVMGLLIENVSKCRVQNCRAYRTGRDGLSVAGKSSDVIITNNHVEKSGDDGISVNSYAFNQTNPAVAISNIVISNNTIRDAGARGILLSNALGAVINGNVIDGSTAWGITLEAYQFGYVGDAIVSNNKIYRASQYVGDINAIEYQTCGGILLRGSPESTSAYGRINISNNIIDAPAKQGIKVVNESSFSLNQLSVSNNTVYFAGDRGISVDKTGSGAIEQINITGNNIRQPKLTGIYVKSTFMANVNNNTVFNVGEGNAVAVDAIAVSTSNESSITSNFCIDSRGASSKQSFGFAITSTSGILLDGNTAIGSVSGGLYQNANSNVVIGTNRPTMA